MCQEDWGETTLKYRDEKMAKTSEESPNVVERRKKNKRAEKFVAWANTSVYCEFSCLRPQIFVYLNNTTKKKECSAISLQCMRTT